MVNLNRTKVVRQNRTKVVNEIGLCTLINDGEDLRATRLLSVFAFYGKKITAGSVSCLTFPVSSAGTKQCISMVYAETHAGFFPVHGSAAQQAM